MPVKISGIQPISNGISLGYPFIEAILSVLPIVDEFLINDGGSSDKTSFYLKRLQKTFPNKIRLFNKSYYKSIHWETIDDCLVFLISRAKGDWLFEVQGDEIWHEKDLIKLKKTIQEASENNYNSIRSVCYYESDFCNADMAYKYRNMRIVRKIKGLRTFCGGDDFQIVDDKEPRQGFTSSNVPPEIMIDIGYYNIGELAFPDNSLKRSTTVFKFFANGDLDRERAWKRRLEEKKRSLCRSPRKFENIKEFPAIIQDLIGWKKYRVRDELFDKTFLSRLTGLKY